MSDPILLLERITLHAGGVQIAGVRRSAPLEAEMSVG